MICDRDCFNCKYDDCINDTLTYEDIKVSDQLDRDSINESLSEKEKRHRLSSLRYYRRNKETINAKQAKYRAENREAYNARSAEHYEKHKEDYRARKMARYYENHEENKKKSRERMRAYREKRKETKLCMISL